MYRSSWQTIRRPPLKRNAYILILSPKSHLAYTRRLGVQTSCLRASNSIRICWSTIGASARGCSFRNWGMKTRMSIWPRDTKKFTHSRMPTHENTVLFP
jgi:hypothetical protein